MDISTCSDLEEVKLILSDFDYTFLDSNHNVSEANAAAFGEVAAAGVIAAIASGRSRGGTLSCLSPAYKELMKYNGFPGVFLNGGVVYGQDGKILSCTEIPLPAQAVLLDKMKEMGILQNILGYTADRVLCIERNDKTDKSHVVYKEPAPEVLSYEEFAATRFVKLVACGTPESTDKARPILEKAVGQQLRCVRPLDWNLEFINPNVSKAVGAQVLLTHLNLTPSQLLAMGDGENDIQVLGLAGVSVAVANACPAAKDAAKYTTVSNDENAFRVVADLLLKAREKVFSSVAAYNEGNA
ncbi:haloacid dehalogenase-like hydrolase domain-containing protein, putative [Eimeria maxima]|uniref:Haloacid dehalogenase-like hydrolase domain-containing protein, putative n=1 Tax=Eimeria maxima TaxID=5804 RepID=U6MFD4_EIMMA|nr:haloacid dehalogenase-like hydrolase domain-containing protein, putative [Eimeria maxima]CDJ61159.1 haloacid dehalogenase-like hydrolase domain-containing protein, putative [Eimeria maxima]